MKKHPGTINFFTEMIKIIGENKREKLLENGTRFGHRLSLFPNVSFSCFLLFIGIV